MALVAKSRKWLSHHRQHKKCQSEYIFRFLLSFLSLPLSLSLINLKKKVKSQFFFNRPVAEPVISIMFIPDLDTLYHKNDFG